MSRLGRTVRGDLLGGDSGFFRRVAVTGASHRLTMIGDHLPDIGDAFTALGLAPHAVKEAGRRAHALGERLLDLLLIKSVADADIHDDLNPADDALLVRAVENECQSLYSPGIAGSPEARRPPPIQSFKICVSGLVPWILPSHSLAKAKHRDRMKK
jgi:hypothetical protein